MATKPTKKVAEAVAAAAPKNHLFPCTYTHDQQVSFIPMHRDCERLAIAHSLLRGRIIGIRFTKAKVLFDIVDDYYGELFRDVDSAKVGKMADLMKMVAEDTTTLVTEAGKKLSTAKKGAKK